MVQPQLIKSFMSSHSTLSGKKGEYITNKASQRSQTLDTTEWFKPHHVKIVIKFWTLTFIDFMYKLKQLDHINKCVSNHVQMSRVFQSANSSALEKCP